MTLSPPPSVPGPRRSPMLAFARLAVVLLALLAMATRPVLAQSILRDAETEALFADMMAPLNKAAGLGERDVKVYLISDRSINAFVAGGQAVYVHAGLIEAADTANEVQGVLAHELGHVMGGHVIRGSESMRSAIGFTILSLILGAAAMAAGAGEAGAGIMAAGQQAALGSYLAFSRTQEATADAAGATYLSKAGISGRGSLDFFKKLQNLEFRYAIPQTEETGYARTHPLSGDRIQTLRESYTADPAWDRPSDPELERRFQRVKAKLSGFVENETPRTFRKYPESDTSIPARYARAYAWHKAAYPEKALAEASALLAADPQDPYFLELKGQILLESGRPREAIAPLRLAVAQTRSHPLVAASLDHALIATEDPAHFVEAEQVLRTAVALDNENPFAWYQLGIVYANKGDNARASLASAERYNLMRQYPLALGQAERALTALPTGTPDWVRAQDIAMTSRAEVERDRKRRR